MVDWEAIKISLAKAILGSDFVRSYLEKRLEESVEYILVGAVAKKVIRKKTAARISTFVKDEDVIRGFLEWYLEKDE